MKRRRFLLGAGSVATLGLVNRNRRPETAPLEVKLWVTEAAAAYPSCRSRSVEYLRAALAPVDRDVEFSFGDRPITVSGADRQVERIGWPRRVLAGATGAASIDPVGDVNLLLTDGSVSDSSAGYAYGHIATVPGARYIESMPPAESTPPIVDYSPPAAVTQLLLHEVGHALGLDHHHGSIVADSSSVTASPMVSGYAWAPGAVQETELRAQTCSTPGTPSRRRSDSADATGSPRREELSAANGDQQDEPPDGDRARRLSFAYSPCAERVLRDYRGSRLL